MALIVIYVSRVAAEVLLASHRLNLAAFLPFS